MKRLHILIAVVMILMLGLFLVGYGILSTPFTSTAISNCKVRQIPAPINQEENPTGTYIVYLRMECYVHQ